jgi:hypothetical protein
MACAKAVDAPTTISRVAAKPPSIPRSRIRYFLFG